MSRQEFSFHLRISRLFIRIVWLSLHPNLVHATKSISESNKKYGIAPDLPPLLEDLDQGNEEISFCNLREFT
ncbi:MAG: hypothetical protein LBH37_03035 [Oscillospiraceae bacterium]|jgi:hypothetical protein|nr:hypothetical protein [Oscillospiraceae bacterium]